MPVLCLDPVRAGGRGDCDLDGIVRVAERPYRLASAGAWDRDLKSGVGARADSIWREVHVSGVVLEPDLLQPTAVDRSQCHHCRNRLDGYRARGAVVDLDGGVK